MDHNEEEHHSSTLLLLPAEILAQVLELVLIDHCNQPQYDEPVQSTWLRELPIFDGDSISVKLDAGMDVISNATNVLKSCRQLYMAMTSAIRRMYPSGPTYNLVQSISKETVKSQARWLHLPFVSKHVQTLVIDCHNIDAFAYGSMDDLEHIWYESFGRAAESLSALLVKFILYGPNWPAQDVDDATIRRKALSRSNNTTIGEIVLNLQVNVHEEADTQAVRLFVKTFLSLFSARLLIPSDMHGVIAWVLEHVETFRCFYNEEVLGEVSIGVILAELCSWATPEYGLPCQQLSFWNWKARAVKGRKERGLHISQHVIWPTAQQLLQEREKSIASAHNECDCMAVDIEALLNALDMT